MAKLLTIKNTTMSPSHSIEKWKSRIQSVSQLLGSEVSGLSHVQLNTAPSVKDWSVARILDHLITVNVSYFPLFEQIRQGTYKASWPGRFPFLVRMNARLVLNSVQPGQKRKQQTFSVWEPSKTDLPDTIFHDFLKHQGQLIEELQLLEPFLSRNMVISSPANRLIVYPLETACEIIVTHEERHLEQILRLIRQLSFKG